MPLDPKNIPLGVFSLEAAEQIAAAINAGGTNLSKTTQISAAQIAAWTATPVELVPAPGAGKFINVLQILMTCNFVTSSYSGTQQQDITFQYGDSGNLAVALGNSEGFMDSGDGGDGFEVVAFLGTQTANGLDEIENLPLTIGCTSSLTGGDSTLTVKVFYTVESLPLA